VIEKTKKKISAKSFFKTLIDLSLDFFSKIMRYVFTWVFPDFLDTLYDYYKYKCRVTKFLNRFVRGIYLHVKMKLFTVCEICCCFKLTKILLIMQETGMAVRSPGDHRLAISSIFSARRLQVG
jgi:hypothetical protein